MFQFLLKVGRYRLRGRPGALFLELFLEGDAIPGEASNYRDNWTPLWSMQKIWEARANPICLRTGFCSSSDWFDYGSEPPTIILGGATVYRPDCVLRVFGQTLLELKGAESSGGPVRISGRFYDKDGRLTIEVEDNCLQGTIDNWDIKTVGTRIEIRRGKELEAALLAVADRTAPGRAVPTPTQESWALATLRLRPAAGVLLQSAWQPQSPR